MYRVFHSITIDRCVINNNEIRLNNVFNKIIMVFDCGTDNRNELD